MRFPLPLTLQTKVGRRIAVLFVVSALLPVGVLAVEGYRQVRDQLVAHATAQLVLGAKSVGMGLLDQLKSAESTLLEIAADIESGDSRRQGQAVAHRRARETFASAAVVNGAGKRALWGDAPRDTLSSAELRWLRDGRRVLHVDETGDQVWVVAGLARGAQLWAAVARSYLFRGASDRAGAGDADIRFCVRVAGTTTWLECPEGAITASVISARWDLFLGSAFGASPWSVELAQSTADALAPIAAFRRTFLLSMILVFGLVIMLTSIQVRRSLQPLAALGQGTRRLTQRDFSGTVSVSSGDEFEELAASFNRMTGEMDQHFRTMTAVSAIDRVALTVVRPDDVAATAAGHMRDVLRDVTVDVFVAGERRHDPWRRIRASDGATQAGDAVQPPAADLDRFRDAGGPWMCGGTDEFGWLGLTQHRAATLFPMTSHEELIGLVALHDGDTPIPDERLRVVRQLADQLAVGLSNARLILSLNGLSYGALSALARTVDANSPWTMGHSERVTALSLRLASRLGLPFSEVHTLYRGALLHDIGKIGVPNYLLDLPAPLSPAQFTQMRKHPSLGATILAPIAAFADAVPLVLRHHERFDGSGYPDGLAGNDIPFLARLLSVADVYDALVSDRPYRGGWPTAEATAMIIADTRTGFDPAMVEALLAVMKDEGDAARFAPPPPELTRLPQ